MFLEGVWIRGAGPVANRRYSRLTIGATLVAPAGSRLYRRLSTGPAQRLAIAFGILFIALARSLPAAEAEIKESDLPPAATVTVDFSRDIEPIFQNSCIRCHGPEKPKSSFRLDNRTAALKGGEHGVDILPGNSAKSPLIHYVAQVVEDMEMPPVGKGDPLTPEQIGLLRAWIDQGAKWGTLVPVSLYDVSFSPTIGVTTVSGNSAKFREQYWRRDGTDGGLEHFELFQQPNADTRETISGHVLRDDYQVLVSLDRNDLGFVHTGWQQYRKYYDDTGGYFPQPSTTGPLRLGEDLHLDIGKAWIDFGLTLPRWPRIVLGYEYDYKNGNEAITSWNSDGSPTDPRNIAPASKHLDEAVHIIKLDFDADVYGFAISDRFRGTFYDLNTSYTNIGSRAGISQDAHDANNYFEGANSIQIEKQFKDWWYGSAGYFFSRLSADDSFSDATMSAGTLYLAIVPDVEQSRITHLINGNTLFGPFDGFTISAGVQSEWTHEKGFGTGDLNGIAYSQPPGGNLDINPATLQSDYDQNTVSETVGLHYTKIPFTALFADARLEQESIGQSDSDIQPTQSFMENPSFHSELTDLRAGFNTSPWQWASLSSHYRRYENDSHYDTNQVPVPAGGYPGFISKRDVVTDEVEARLVTRVSARVKTTLTYRMNSTQYKETTRDAFTTTPPAIISPGGSVLAARDNSYNYSFGATVIPQRRITLNGTFSYENSGITTMGNGLIPSYKGDIYSVLFGGTYMMTHNTDLSLNYGFSMADYNQGTLAFSQPPPVGIRYQQHAVHATLSRRINQNLSVRLQYGFYYYNEPPAEGVNDYRAHTVFATLNYRFR